MRLAAKLAGRMLVGLVAGLTGMAFASAEEPPLSRDAIWRSIFARPAAAREGAERGLAGRRRALGEKLFSDPRLSGSGTRSCRSCHRPENAFTDGMEKGLGLDGTALKRNTPHLWNLAEAKSFFWDGRAASLEAQARGPLYAANELAVDMPRTLRLLAADEAMAKAFADAFPEDPGVSEKSLLAALASYERSIVSPDTRFDAWVRGDDQALNEKEKAGFAIFVGKGGCVSCHGGWRFTDDLFHDIGLETTDPGRSAVAGGAAGIAAFKTPGLRQVARTAPYMHGGSFARLEDVVAHYAGKRTLRPSLSPNVVRDLQLDAEERAALIAFLRTL